MSGSRRGRGSGPKDRGDSAGQARDGQSGAASEPRASRRRRRSAVKRGPGAARRPGKARSRASKSSSRGRWIERTLWIAVVGFLLWRLYPQIAAGLGMPSSSEQAPNVSVRTLSGQNISLAALRGQVVLVNFWATWCPPCRMEIPGLEAVYRRHRADGFTIVGLSEDQTGAAGVASYIEQHGVTYPVAMSTGAADNAFGGIEALPSSFLIDRKGRIRYRITGIFTEPALGQAVRRLLAEKPGAGAGNVVGAATGGSAGTTGGEGLP